MKYYLRRIAFVTLGAFIVAGTTSLPAIADSGVKGAVSGTLWMAVPLLVPILH